ncbi:MAG: glycoside hydrolase family 97 N-terminal domain-containing protein, partial [Prevotella sp.]|nr:glycoside hydrolase family 97 N-terminal domain-containing protein [Prevotella sp.]
MKLKLLTALLLAPLCASAATVTSPNGNVELKFYLDNTGRPIYEMNYKGRPVVLPSHLGLELAKDKHASMGQNERNLLDGFKLKDEQQSTFDETWTPVWGETATIRNHYVDYAATLLQQWKSPRVTAREGERGMIEEQHQREIIIRFRVYDDGIGFRYEFPQQKDLNYFLIQEEKSEFAMTGDHPAWWLPGDYDTQEQVT